MDRRPLHRRTFLATAALAAAPRRGWTDALSAASPLPEPDVFIGTGGYGHTFPGPTLPHGLVQLGPDTDNARWDVCSGYHADDATIMGFSHTHLSGTGGADLLDLLVVPRTGPVTLHPGTLAEPAGSYRSGFDRASERAAPGFYAVRLDSGILAELTATLRAGLHRYTFPPGAGHLILDWAHTAVDAPGALPRVSEATLALLPDGTIVGQRRVAQWANGRRVFFALQLSRPFDRATLYAGDIPLGDARAAAGGRLKAALHWDDAGAAPLLVRVGISIVDADGARRNLETELPDLAFERVRMAARAAWTGMLGAVRAPGGAAAERTILATSLYHLRVGPTHVDDADGRYRGMDGAIHDAGADGAYSCYSIWDIYRAVMPLLWLLDPVRAAVFCRDMIGQSAQSASGPLIWPLMGVETATMPGRKLSVILAEAHRKGLPRDEIASIWPAFRTIAFDKADEDYKPYRELGYIPCDTALESATRTIDYAYDDWAMAVLADAAGATDDARALRDRSKTWRNVYDAASKFVRPRLASGDWAEPFEPTALGRGLNVRDFTEMNAWQATFAAQHDVYGAIAAMGGDAAFEARLDALFAAAPGTAGDDVPPDLSGWVGQYVAGNEPSQHIAYLYAYAGAQWKTARWVRAIMAGQYGTGRDGLPGNDDYGQMGAWYVFSAMGFYPVDPVTTAYVFGSPLFEVMEADLGGGRTLRIEAPGNGEQTPYIQSVTWNGAPHARAWIAHGDLAQGGVLRFAMGREPNREFGAAPGDRPPSGGTPG